MRILHVIDGLGGSGGAENRLVEEVLNLEADQVVVRLYERNFLQQRLEQAGIRVISLGLHGRNGAWNWPLAAWRIYQVAKSYQPDLIHTSLFASNLAGQLAGILSGTAVVSTMTLTGDPDLHKRLQPGAATWRAWLLRRLGAAVARHRLVRYRAVTHDAMVTNCEAMHLTADRVEVIPRGVDRRRGEAVGDRERFGLPHSVPVFLNVARQTAQKGHVLLIEAFAEILNSLPEARLVIAGEESDASSALHAAITSHDLARHVDLIGFRPDVEVLMASVDVFVFSSLAEGLGTVLLEALLAGRPVVAFDIPPVREALAGAPGAWLIPPGDVIGLAKRAVEAFSSPEDRAAAARGRSWVLENYELQAVAARLQNYLRSVAGSASR